MKSFGKAINESADTIFKNTGLRISDHKDEKGRFIIENFDGDIEELAKKLDCITIENAIKQFNNIQNGE